MSVSNLDKRINAARLAGAHSLDTFPRFKNYLLELGLAKYEKAILPLENPNNHLDHCTAQTRAKIISFPVKNPQSGI